MHIVPHIIVSKLCTYNACTCIKTYKPKENNSLKIICYA